MATQVTFKTIWREIDSHLVNVRNSVIQGNYEQIIEPLDFVPLFAYLDLFGFGFLSHVYESTTDYCLAHTDDFKLKYRKHGGSIIIYLTPLH